MPQTIETNELKQLWSQLQSHPEAIALIESITEMHRQELAEKSTEIAAKDAEVLRLRELVVKFRDMLFAASSEKRPVKVRIPEAEEIDLWDKLPAEAPARKPAPETEKITYERKKRAADQNRQKLPEHLERRIERIELPEGERTCGECGTALEEMGAEITEELEIIPAKVVVRQIVRVKYKCPTDTLHGIYVASMPPRIIPKGIAGPSLLAHILISKYVDHLPLERQEKILLRHGVKVPKSTMSDWMGKVRGRLDPLLECLQGKMLASRIVNCDETTMMVQNNAVSGAKKDGYLWSYIGDSRWVWFDWQEGRSRAGPLGVLGKFGGEYLQSDGYAAYGIVVDKLVLRHLGCWAHARRKFVEAYEAGARAAGPIVESIAKLYAVEKEARELELGPFAVRALRQERSVPALAELHASMSELAQTAVPKGALGKALAYSLERWPQLTVYCEDGDLSIDNNIVERAIRPVALGRKNWLFAGSEGGAKWAAGFYSLIETAKLHGVEPGEYLTEVLRHIAAHGDGEDLESLLPDRYNLHSRHT